MCDEDFFAGIGGGFGVCESLAAQTGFDAAAFAVLPAGLGVGERGGGDEGVVDAHGRYKRGNGLEGGGEGVRRQRGRGVGVRGEVSAV